MIRTIVIAIAVVLLAGCERRVIDLGRVDAPDGIPACACRLPCASTVADCAPVGSASTCAADHFCTGSLNVCTRTTPQPCSAIAASSVCTNSESSTVTCGQ
jgi:hypothetical protein